MTNRMLFKVVHHQKCWPTANAIKWSELRMYPTSPKNGEQSSAANGVYKMPTKCQHDWTWFNHKVMGLSLGLFFSEYWYYSPMIETQNNSGIHLDYPLVIHGNQKFQVLDDFPGKVVKAIYRAFPNHLWLLGATWTVRSYHFWGLYWVGPRLP